MMSIGFHVREARPADAGRIVAFNHALARETEDIELDRSVLEQGVHRALALSGACRYHVAEWDGEVVGQLMITLEWSDWRNAWIWWIQSVYVVPEHRRHGVFRTLYHHVRELARAGGGVCGLRLYAVHDNHRALETYRALGMKRTDYIVLEDGWGGPT